jgi:ABC-type branched-subunit amino acid transport system substrate-binding protein
MTGRIDFATVTKAVSPDFITAGGLDKAASISMFSPAIQTPGVQDFVNAYESKYGLVPNQLPFYAYEATFLIVDAIRRAGSDKPADIEQALKTTTMPSLLGGTYVMDDHNHSHMPLQVVGLRNGKVAVIGAGG